MLKRDRLFYFLTARKDTRGDDLSLLGEERGSIKMIDIEDVATGAGRYHVLPCFELLNTSMCEYR